MKKNELTYKQLKEVCNPNVFNFETTDELDNTDLVYGQERGINALQFGLNIKATTKDENIALLTGANSGGKTTLLETLTQISIMAQMGLPVSADKAEIKLFDEIYHFSKWRYYFLQTNQP